MQHIHKNICAWLNHPRPLEQLPAVNAHLRPSSFNERLTTRSVDVLLEACPANSARTHRAGFRRGVERQLLPGFACLLRRKLIRTIRISQNGSAVVDGGDFAMQCWVSVVGDSVGSDTDEVSVAAGGVIDNSCAERTERAGLISRVIDVDFSDRIAWPC
jgi:hypothetical protein